MIFKTILALCLIKLAVSDTLANCTYEDATGVWTIFTDDISYPCNESKLPGKKTFTLVYPNLAIDENGNYGQWTLIYNQGFEVIVNNMKYFGFFDFKTINDTYAISYCNRLQHSWYHDVLVRQWGCFRAQKTSNSTGKEKSFSTLSSRVLQSIMYGSQKDLVESINSKNIGWTAKDYPEFHKKTLYEMVSMAGGLHARLNRPKSADVSREIAELAQLLPTSFDWRNVSGINYVSPVRHQDNCGSCYAFASAGMLEARFRIRSNNTATPVLSPQDVIECSPYSQGCKGGFPYLIAGKFAEDFGMVTEECNPYKGHEGACSTTTNNCQRYYATKYKYIGGFYGATNEPLMRLELVQDGPIAVSFEVYGDFKAYHGGVYHHVVSTRELTTSKFGFNPFELTNHVVVIVGYGQTDSGEKYWIVKNSWSEAWGENGYFRIRRGCDECGIESIAMSSEPII